MRLKLNRGGAATPGDRAGRQQQSKQLSEGDAVQADLIDLEGFIPLDEWLQQTGHPEAAPPDEWSPDPTAASRRLVRTIRQLSARKRHGKKSAPGGDE